MNCHKCGWAGQPLEKVEGDKIIQVCKSCGNEIRVINLKPKNKKEGHSFRIDPEIRREAKILATNRGITFGRLIEEILKREIEDAKNRGWKVELEGGI